MGGLVGYRAEVVSDCGSKAPEAQVRTIGVGLRMVGGGEMIDLGEIRRWK